MRRIILVVSVTIAVMAGYLNGQTASPATAVPKPAPAATSAPAVASAPATAAVKTNAPKAPATPKGNPQVDHVISLAKNGMSEAFIIKGLKKTNKAIDLTPADMGRLKQAGLSETLIGVMLDPSSAADAPQPTVAPSVPALSPVVAPTPSAGGATVMTVSTTVSTTVIPPKELKKRVIVDPFDYSAVMTSVQAVFGTQQNVGKGIQAMLVTRIHHGEKLVIVDRAKVQEVKNEQDNSVGNRNKQGTGPRIGRIAGADAIIAGDIVIFGRDDKKKGAGAAFLTGWCRACGAVAFSKKEEKFVVAVNYRLIDTETSEVIETGEARGESKRVSRDWAAIGAALGTGVGGAVDMTSSNFAETIIGEAAQDCVSKLAEILNQKTSDMKKRVREVEALVADISGDNLTISAGSGDGVNIGETFDILRVEREVKDPVTNEVLDRITTKVGEMTVGSVHDKVATGTYVGGPAAVKYVARKRMPAQS